MARSLVSAHLKSTTRNDRR